MGVFRKLFTRPSDADVPVPEPEPASGRVWSDIVASFPAHAVHDGRHDLEVVGESNYQEALWALVGGWRGERVRVDIQAVLATEPDNPYDTDAVSVWILGRKVGYLARDDAAAYRPGLLALERAGAKPIGLVGVVTGGGVRADGPGMLGVWLSCDPARFGIQPLIPPAASPLRATLRTGLTEALLTDEADDSYDLSWLETLPSDHGAAITRLRRLLRDEVDPIDRHFMYSELEERLYRSRDAFSSALTDYDEVCACHDAEMDSIGGALLTKFGRMPLLDTYRQMAVRQQKAKNWPEALRWARRGLELYGDNAARPEAVENLRKRAAAYAIKLDGKSAPTKVASRISAPVAETLTCGTCGGQFDRAVAPGRKPRLCPSCRV